MNTIVCCLMFILIYLVDYRIICDPTNYKGYNRSNSVLNSVLHNVYHRTILHFQTILI